MQSKNALGNLKNRYIAVLKKCNLLNVFGSLAVLGALTMGFGVSHAFAEAVNTGDVNSMDATNGNYQVLQPSDPNITHNDPVLTNDGTITDGGLYDWGLGDYTVGIFGYHGSGSKDYTFTNNGTIEIKKETTSDINFYYQPIAGMYALVDGNNSSSNTLTNTAKITLENKLTSNNQSSSLSTYAMYAVGIGNHVLTNEADGEITIITTGISANNYADPTSYGLVAQGDGNHELTNKGKITITSSTEGYDAPTTVAYGIAGSGDGQHTLINSNELTITNTATSPAGNSYVESYAMHADGMGSGHTLTNESDGVITITNTATSDSDAESRVQAMIIERGGDNKLTNAGRITINNTTTSKNGASTAYIWGMSTDAVGNHTLVNSGIIEITNEDNTSNEAETQIAAMHATGDGSHTLTNSGAIKINNKITSTNGIAISAVYGMFLPSSSGTEEYVLTNTGVIELMNEAKAGAGKVALSVTYEAGGESSFTVDTWATTLRTWSANDTVFGLANGKTITFANGTEGATFILRPGTAEQGFVMGEEYKVANMIAIADANGEMQLQDTINNSIIGSIAEVKTELDILEARIDDSDPDSPTVSLHTVALEMPALDVVTGQLSINENQLVNVATQIQATVLNIYKAANYSGPVSTDNNTASIEAGIAAGSVNYQPRWAIFGTPYGSYISNSKYDSNTGTYGITAGASYSFNPQLALGFHLDFNGSSSDANALDYDATSFAFGVNGNYFINSNWYVNGQATLSFASNDVEYNLLGETASDDFSSTSFFAGINTGYVFEIKENNFLIPEIGLSYLYSSSDSYNFDFVINDVYDMGIYSNDYSALYGTLTLTWEGNYAMNNSLLVPSLGVGIRQNLSGNDIDSKYEFLGVSEKTTVSTDSTTFLVNAGLEWTSGNFTIGAFYDGGFGSDQQSHTGSLQAIYRF